MQYIESNKKIKNNTEFIITIKGFVFPTRPSGVIPGLQINDYLEYFDLIENNINTLLANKTLSSITISEAE